MTEIEEKFNASCEMKKRGQDEQAHRLLYDGYLAYCSDPYMLGNVKNYALVGNCLCAFYFTPTIQESNESIMEQVASIAFLFLSKAIEKDSQNVQLRSIRIYLLDKAKEYIKHIFVESEIDIPNNIPFSVAFESPACRALIDIDKMIYSELINSPQITSNRYFGGLKDALENDRLVPNRFVMSSINEMLKKEYSVEGKAFLQKFISFLNQKVCIDGDIDFDTEYD